jgi:hypothetical protein
MGTTSKEPKLPPVAELIATAFKYDDSFRKDINRLALDTFGSEIPAESKVSNIDYLAFDKHEKRMTKLYPFSRRDLFVFALKGEWSEDKYINVEIPTGASEDGFKISVIGELTKSEFENIWNTEIQPNFVNKRKNKGVENTLLAYSVIKAKMSGKTSAEIAKKLSNGKLMPFQEKRDLTYQQIDKILFNLRKSLESST